MFGAVKPRVHAVHVFTREIEEIREQILLPELHDLPVIEPPIPRYFVYFVNPPPAAAREIGPSAA